MLRYSKTKSGFRADDLMCSDDAPFAGGTHCHAQLAGTLAA